MLLKLLSKKIEPKGLFAKELISIFFSPSTLSQCHSVAGQWVTMQKTPWLGDLCEHENCLAAPDD
jgi:hypothetical protein